MAQIDIEKLAELTADSDKIFLSAEGENVLVQLLEIQEQVNAAVAAAELKLEEAGLKLNANFSSIQGDRVKVSYRPYGPKYYIDEENIGLAPKELYTIESKVTYKIDADAVEKWTDEHKGMPAGIKEVERKKSLKFGLKKPRGAKNGE